MATTKSIETIIANELKKQMPDMIEQALEDTGYYAEVIADQLESVLKEAAASPEIEKVIVAKLKTVVTGLNEDDIKSILIQQVLRR